MHCPTCGAFLRNPKNLLNHQEHPTCQARCKAREARKLYPHLRRALDAAAVVGPDAVLAVLATVEGAP